MIRQVPVFYFELYPRLTVTSLTDIIFVLNKTKKLQPNHSRQVISSWFDPFKIFVHINRGICICIVLFTERMVVYLAVCPLCNGGISLIKKDWFWEKINRFLVCNQPSLPFDSLECLIYHVRDTFGCSCSSGQNINELGMIVHVFVLLCF